MLVGRVDRKRYMNCFWVLVITDFHFVAFGRYFGARADGSFISYIRTYTVCTACTAH